MTQLYYLQLFLARLLRIEPSPISHSLATALRPCFLPDIARCDSCDFLTMSESSSASVRRQESGLDAAKSSEMSRRNLEFVRRDGVAIIAVSGRKKKQQTERMLCGPSVIERHLKTHLSRMTHSWYVSLIWPFYLRVCTKFSKSSRDRSAGRVGARKWPMVE